MLPLSYKKNLHDEDRRRFFLLWRAYDMAAGYPISYTPPYVLEVGPIKEDSIKTEGLSLDNSNVSSSALSAKDVARPFAIQYQRGQQVQDVRI